MTLRFARHRRLRASPSLRDIWRETRLSPAHLVAPMFVTADSAMTGPVAGLPGVRRHAIDALADEVGAASAAGVRGVILFGVTSARNVQATGAWDPDGVVPQALRSIRRAVPEVALIADVCLCQYTTAASCDIANATGSGAGSDATLGALARAAVVYADAGADLVAPSGMMDGAVATIRQALDAAGHARVGILAYAVKHASALYGPFRAAVASEPSHDVRQSHQMDPANAREAIREARSDVEEGADVIMVKPALTNLDTLTRLRAEPWQVPLAAFEVSGEYVMLEAAAERGLLDRRSVALEQLTAIRRAGADMIVTYRAVQAARWIVEGNG